MFKKDLGNFVASEMESILRSNEYNLLFGKMQSKVAEDSAKKLCTCGCEKCGAMGEHAVDACDCASMKKKEALELIAQQMVALSADLDTLNLPKSSEHVLGVINTLVSEAAELTITEDEAEKALEEIPVEIISDEEPLDERLLETMEADKDLPAPKGPTPYAESFLGKEQDSDVEKMLQELTEKRYPLMESEGKSLEELLAELQGLDEDRSKEEYIDSLIEQAKEEYLPEEEVEIEALNAELDDWLQKNADEELLEMLNAEADLELDADLKDLLSADEDLEEDLINLASDDDDDDEEEEEEDFEDEED